jgi:arylsulfatase
MKRRELLKILGLSAGGMMTGGLRGAADLPSLGPGQSADRPNIVFIMADDLGWNELGCYGQEKIQTPNIDRLADSGMRFTRAYSGSPVCAPARCNLMTGMHAGHAYVRSNYEVENPTPGVFGGQLPIPYDTTTVAEVLRQQGYTTGCFGKWGLGAPHSSGDPLSQGFDRFYGYNCQRHAHNLYPRYIVDDRENVTLEGNTRSLIGDHYGPQLIADQMLDFVRENQDEPFFLYYPTLIPHLPLQVPERFLEIYDGMWPETPYDGTGSYGYLPHATPRAAYAAMITFMDFQVGRLMSQLRDLGLYENTLVFFTSDNGTTFLERQVDYEFFNSVGPLRGLKGSVYEGGIREPFIAHWPGVIEGGAVSDQQVTHYDMMATLADLTGAEAPPTDGVSVLPTLLGREDQQEDHEYLFWDFSGYGGQLAVRMGHWKGVKRGLRENADAPLELYNLEADLSENTDLAELHPQKASQIEEVMVAGRTRPETEEFQFGEYS